MGVVIFVLVVGMILLAVGIAMLCDDEPIGIIPATVGVIILLGSVFGSRAVSVDDHEGFPAAQERLLKGATYRLFDQQEVDGSLYVFVSRVEGVQKEPRLYRIEEPLPDGTEYFMPVGADTTGKAKLLMLEPVPCPGGMAKETAE